MIKEDVVQSVSQPRGTTVPIPMERARETIYAELKAKIEAKAPGYEPETRLPTQAALAAKYKVSRATISRVMDDLTEEGLVVGRGRNGTWVPKRSTDE